MKIFIMILCLFIFTGCENAKMNPTQQSGDSIEEYESEYYKVIGLAEFKELYASSTPQIIYFGSEGCSACQSFKPIAKQFAKEKQVNVYFVLTDNFTEEEYNELNELVTFSYIPFVTIYKNKEQLYGDSGVLSLDQLIDLAKTHGVISE